MIKLLKKLCKKDSFYPVRLEETTRPIANPYRGWFDIQVFNIEVEPLLENRRNSESFDRLVLVMIDIGAVREKKLEDQEFSRIEKILSFYHELGKDVILRISYDALGKGMEREPYSFDRVLLHAEQIAEFVSGQKDKIFLYQGLLVGKWGEMHTTKFLSTEKLGELNLVFEEKIGGSVYRAVRKPVQWRLLNQWRTSLDKVEPKGLGIFNDGMFGSESDLGTFDMSNKDTKLWCSPWNRENEIAFISLIAQEVPYGGEALFGEGFAASHSTQDYIRELRRLNVTYLNRHHDKKLIELWKKDRYYSNDVWNGHSCFDYIGEHLGYRFLIKSVGMTNDKEDKTLKVVIENKGFANLYAETELLLQIENVSQIAEKVFIQKLNLCKAGTSREFILKLDLSPGKYYLSAKTVKTNISILFANTNSDVNGRVYIGEVKG